MSKAIAYAPQVRGPLLDRLPTPTNPDAPPGSEVPVDVRKIKGANSGNTGQDPVTVNPTIIGGGRNTRRRTLWVRNIGAVDVYLGFDQSVTPGVPGTGWRLANTDQPMLIETTAAVYAVVNPGADGLVNWLAEVDTD